MTPRFVLLSATVGALATATLAQVTTTAAPAGNRSGQARATVVPMPVGAIRTATYDFATKALAPRPPVPAGSVPCYLNTDGNQTSCGFPNPPNTFYVATIANLGLAASSEVVDWTAPSITGLGGGFTDCGTTGQVSQLTFAYYAADPAASSTVDIDVTLYPGGGPGFGVKGPPALSGQGETLGSLTFTGLPANNWALPTPSPTIWLLTVDLTSVGNLAVANGDLAWGLRFSNANCGIVLVNPTNGGDPSIQDALDTYDASGTYLNTIFFGGCGVGQFASMYIQLDTWDGCGPVAFGLNDPLNTGVMVPGGTGKIGSQLTMTFASPPAAPIDCYLLVARTPDNAVFNGGAVPVTLFFKPFDVVGAKPKATFNTLTDTPSVNFEVPNNPVLVGLQIWAQGLFIPVGVELKGTNIQQATNGATLTICQ